MKRCSPKMKLRTITTKTTSGVHCLWPGQVSSALPSHPKKHHNCRDTNSEPALKLLNCYFYFNTLIYVTYLHISYWYISILAYSNFTSQLWTVFSPGCTFSRYNKTLQSHMGMNYWINFISFLSTSKLCDILTTHIYCLCTCLWVLLDFHMLCKQSISGSVLIPYTDETLPSHQLKVSVSIKFSQDNNASIEIFSIYELIPQYQYHHVCYLWIKVGEMNGYKCSQQKMFKSVIPLVIYSVS